MGNQDTFMNLTFGDEQTEVLNIDSTDLRASFIGWQCRLRQIAMREDHGRPSIGMRPKLGFIDDETFSDEITVLLVRQDAVSDASRFKYLFHKTQDPRIRYESALEFLSSTYYQQSREFSDELTGLFDSSMLLVQKLLSAGNCLLEFSQFSASYRFNCKVRQIPIDEPAYQTTYWHNRLFNPTMPGDIVVLGFLPDWVGLQTN